MIDIAISIGIGLMLAWAIKVTCESLEKRADRKDRLWPLDST
jgi:hypothetical protein